jgi:hypothetical protein
VRGIFQDHPCSVTKDHAPTDQHEETTGREHIGEPKSKDLAGVRFLPEDYKYLEDAAEEPCVSMPVLIRAQLGMPLPGDPPVGELRLVASNATARANPQRLNGVGKAQDDLARPTRDDQTWDVDELRARTS